MPKLFDFFGGEQRTSGVSQALTSRTQAEIAAAGMRSQSMDQAMSLFAVGLNQALERKQNAKLAREELAQREALQARALAQEAALTRENQAIEVNEGRLTREQRAKEFETNLLFGRQSALSEILGRLGVGAMGAGVPPGAVMEQLGGDLRDTLEMSTPGPLPGIPPPGGGGDLIGMQDSGYRGLMQEKQGGYSKWQVPPPPPSEGDKDREWLDEVGKIQQELDLFETSAEGQKLMLPVKKPRLWAFGWQNLPPKDLDQAVVDRFGQSYAPTKSTGPDGGKEDRSALDGLIQWLREPMETHVMGGAAVAGMRNSLWGRFRPGPIDQALTERYGNKVARTKAEIETLARKQMLEEMAAVEPIGNQVQSSVQAPSFSSLMGKAQDEELANAVAGGTPGPVQLTEDSLSGLNINTGSLGNYTKAAMKMPGYYWLELDQATNQVVVQGRPGLVISPVLVKEINETFNDPKKKEPYAAIRAGSKLGQTMKRTAGEMRNATTLEGLKAPAPAPVKPPEPTGSPADQGLQGWNAMRMKAMAGQTLKQVARGLFRAR